MNNESPPSARHDHGEPQVPESPGSGWLVVAFFTLFGFLATVLAVNAFRTYGWTLFVGLPFALGFMPVLIRGANRRLRFKEGFVLATIPVLGVAALMFAVAMEGGICIIMAGPIWLGAAWLGGGVAFAIHLGLRPYPWPLVIGLMATVPGLMGAEALLGPAAAVKPVTTAVIVEAGAQEVWDQLIAFDALPEERHWLFHTGVAYPVQATIVGRGVGAVRHCVFSTGAFVEPIEIWDEPRLLRFSVIENPPPMQEWSLYADVHPPHLEGFMVSRRGQFKLTPLAEGRTRLEGTTWYRHGLWPQRYWRLFSDSIIHQIHRRVLEHIKDTAEQRSAVTATPPRASWGSRRPRGIWKKR